MAREILVPYCCYYCCCCAVTQPCLILFNLMDCSTPGFPVLHCLLEFAQTHVHWVDDAIQRSNPLSPPSLLALNLHQDQGLFQWADSSYKVAKILELSFTISPFSEYSGLISFSSPIKDQTYISCIARQILNHRTTQEVPECNILKKSKLFQTSLMNKTLKFLFSFFFF